MGVCGEWGGWLVVCGVCVGGCVGSCNVCVCVK